MKNFMKNFITDVFKGLIISSIVISVITSSFAFLTVSNLVNNGFFLNFEPVSLKYIIFIVLIITSVTNLGMLLLAYAIMSRGKD